MHSSCSSRGWLLPKFAILICDMVVYAEFLIHPVVLLMTSTRMRSEIGHTLKRLVAADLGNGRPAGGAGNSCSCSSWATGCVGRETSCCIAAVGCLPASH